MGSARMELHWGNVFAIGVAVWIFGDMVTDLVLLFHTYKPECEEGGCLYLGVSATAMVAPVIIAVTYLLQYAVRNRDWEKLKKHLLRSIFFSHLVSHPEPLLHCTKL